MLLNSKGGEEAAVSATAPSSLNFKSLAAEMSREGSCSAPEPPAPEASVFACVRVALAKLLPGDTAEYNGSAVTITETHGDRFVSVQSAPSARPQRVLVRDVSLLSPSGRCSEAVATRREAEVLACAHECEVDASGKSSKRDQRAAQRAKWQQYHLLECGCSDALGPDVTPVSLIVEAKGRDQVRRRQRFVIKFARVLRSS
jgi:hypothetical protein